MDPEKFSGFLLLYDRCICQYSVGSAALAEVLGLRVFLVKIHHSIIRENPGKPPSECHHDGFYWS